VRFAGLHLRRLDGPAEARAEVDGGEPEGDVPPDRGERDPLVALLEQVEALLRERGERW
jgi:hypothetical protein